MFSIPEDYKTIRLLAIDPGLNNIGVAVFIIDAITMKMCHIEALTLKEEKVLDGVYLDDDYASDRMAKRMRMKEAVLRFVKEINPSVLVSESPFFNRKMPASFVALTEIINDIFTSTQEYDNNIRLATVEPLLVKHTLGVAGQKGKDVVRDALSTFSDIMAVLENPIPTLDEHAIDAVGVGYTFFKRRILPKESKK